MASPTISIPARRWLRLSLVAAFGLLALGAKAADPDAPIGEGGTGKVPVEGALTANTLTPRVGDVVYVYFVATPLIKGAAVALEVKLPAGLTSIGHEPETHPAGDSAAMAFAARVTTPGEKKIIGNAVLHASADATESRAFVLTLNPKSAAP